jgi:hypothetical protein
MDSDKTGLLRYGYTYENKHKRAALMFELYGIRMGV